MTGAATVYVSPLDAMLACYEALLPDAAVTTTLRAAVRLRRSPMPR